MGNHLNIDRFCAAMSKIFSDKYGCEVTFTAVRRDEVNADAEETGKEEVKAG